MKFSIKALVSGSMAVALLLVGNGLAQAQKGGRGGNSGGSRSSFSGSSARMSSSMSQSAGRSSGMKVNPASAQNLTRNTNLAGISKSSLPQITPAGAKKTGSTLNTAGRATSVAKLGSVSKSNIASMVSQPQNFSRKSAFFGSLSSGAGCFPHNHYGWNHCHWNHCHTGFGFGFGFGCGCYYPWHNHCYYPAYYPCYTTCYTPICDYYSTSPVVYTYQSPVVVTQVVEQATPVVETAAATATTTVIKPPSPDVSFLTSSALQQ